MPRETRSPIGWPAVIATAALMRRPPRRRVVTFRQSPRATCAMTSQSWKRLRAGAVQRAHCHQALRAEICDNVFAVACFCEQWVAQFPVVRESQQRLLRDRVDRAFGAQGLNIQRVRCRRILGARAGPKEALRDGHQRPRASSNGRIRVTRDRLCRHAWQSQCRGGCETGRTIDSSAATSQRLTKSEATDPTFRSRLRRRTAFKTTHVSVRRSQIVVTREEQRNIDRDAGEDGFLDRENSLRRARDLDQEIRAGRLRVQARRRSNGAGGVVRRAMATLLKIPNRRRLRLLQR